MAGFREAVVSEDFPAGAAVLAAAERAAVGKRRDNQMRSQHPILFFSKKEKERIISAIEQAEKETSGEIRVHLARGSKKEIFDLLLSKK